MQINITADVAGTAVAWKTALLVTYNVALLVLGVLGNSFVLYATLGYSDTCVTMGTMNKVTVALVRQLAVCDLLCLLLLLIPALSVYLCHTCLLGSQEGMCVYTMFSRQSLASANFKFVFLISLHRLCRCYKPHVTIQPRFVELAAALVYVISLSEMGLTYLTISEGAFKTTSYGCYMDITNSSPVGRQARFSHFGLAVLVPFCGTLLTNVALWSVACRATGKFDRKPLITVSVISGLLLVSWLPFIVYAVQKYLVHSAHTDYAAAEEAAFSLMMFSMCSNPAVYTLFSKSLLDFLKLKLRMWGLRSARVGHSQIAGT